MELTQDRLKELLDYSPGTGEFRWRVSPAHAVKAGTLAGTVNPHGYRAIMIARRLYHAGRLAFLYMTGRLPAHQVDHKNRNRADDRWDNLREATPAQNCANTSLSKFNTSGFRGVYFHKPTEKWLASARVRCERRYLGLFKTAEEAGAVAAAARRDAFGEFAAL